MSYALRLRLSVCFSRELLHSFSWTGVDLILSFLTVSLSLCVLRTACSCCLLGAGWLVPFPNVHTGGVDLGVQTLLPGLALVQGLYAPSMPGSVLMHNDDLIRSLSPHVHLLPGTEIPLL